MCMSKDCFVNEIQILLYFVYILRIHVHTCQFRVNPMDCVVFGICFSLVKELSLRNESNEQEPEKQTV